MINTVHFDWVKFPLIYQSIEQGLEKLTRSCWGEYKIMCEQLIVPGMWWAIK